jgi:chromosomal replication initiation ATPase DnaA
MSPRLRAEIQATFFFVAEEQGLHAAIDAVARAGADAAKSIRGSRQDVATPIVRRIAAYLDMPVEQFRNGRRGTSNERHLALWAIRQLGYSYPAAARAVGLSHHTSAIHGVRRVKLTPELLDRAQRMLAVIGHGDCASAPNADDSHGKSR